LNIDMLKGSKLKKCYADSQREGEPKSH
jgi:hypothetical protein